MQIYLLFEEIYIYSLIKEGLQSHLFNCPSAYPPTNLPVDCGSTVLMQKILIKTPASEEHFPRYLLYFHNFPTCDKPLLRCWMS